MTNSFDIVLRYLIDKQASAQVEQGTRQITSDLDDVQKSAVALDRTFNHLEQQMKKATTLKDFESIERQMKDVKDEVNETTRAYALQARVMRATASAITNDLEKAQLALVSNLGDRLAGLSTLALGTGTGIIGGIFAAANKYVKDAEQATEVTLEWKAAQDSLAQSGTRIGAVLAEQALPLLRDVARLANETAGFVESHPELVGAALNTGKILIALGAVGILASRGIKLFTDARYLLTIPAQLEAARLQDRAAEKQLAAAVLRAKGQGIDVSTGGGVPGGAGVGGLLGGITSPLGIAALIGGTAIASVKAADGLKQLEERLLKIGGPAALPFITFLDTVIQNVSPLIVPIKNLKVALERDLPGIKRIIDQFTGASTTAGGTAGASATASLSSVPTGALKAFEDYRADDLKLVQDHYRDRQKIISDSLKAEQAENSRYASSVARVTTQRNRALADADQDLARDNERAAVEFAQRQAEIIRDGDQQIEEIRIRSADRLRKLAQDHSEREEALTASRDALGLAKERRRYTQEVAEENRQTSQEVQQRRREIAQRLADLQQSYEQERVQRLADYQSRVAEIRANAAAQLAELASQHASELREIRAQRIARIRELDIQFLDERKRRREYFIAQIRELDASLLGEANLRKQRQAQMLLDLDAFLTSYRSKLQSLSTTGTVGSRSGGGYATYGQYLLGDDASGAPGTPEYVIRGDTTKMIERMIGGAITPEKLMGRLMVGGSNVNSRSVTYNDKRRIDSRIPASDRERLLQDAVSAMTEVLQ